MLRCELFQPAGCLNSEQTVHTCYVSIGMCPFEVRMMTACVVACWCRDAMLAALSAGRTLVVDRYAYSGAAFTAAKGVPGLDLAWCKVKSCPGTHLQPAWTVLACSTRLALHLSLTELSCKSHDRSSLDGRAYQWCDLQAWLLQAVRRVCMRCRHQTATCLLQTQPSS